MATSKNNNWELIKLFREFFEQFHIPNVTVKNSREIQSILENYNIDPTIQNKKYKNTLLHIATIQNNTHAIKLLLTTGIDVNIRNYNNKTPLHSIAHICEEFHMRCFLAKNINNEDKITETIQLLLDNQANVNAVDNHGNTVLHLFCKMGLVKTIQFLLDNNANYEIRNFDSKTPFNLEQRVF